MRQLDLAIVATAERPPLRRGAYLFNERDLQQMARAARKRLARVKRKS